MSSAESGNREDPAASYFGRDLEGMSFAVNYHREIIRMFRPHLGASVLEIGAGSGNFSEFIAGTGVVRHVALEPSENMFPLLEQAFEGKPGGAAHRSVLKDLPAHEKDFDGVFYVNVLEHVRDDRAELLEAYSRLKPGGRLLIFIPALPWLFGTADEHFGHFRRYYKPELDALVKSAGFEIVKSRYFDLAGVVPWWVLFVLLKRRCFTPGLVKVYDGVVVPFMSVFGRRIAPPLGKNILLVAKKPD